MFWGTRVRKILRDIWSRKVRTILVSLSIFIGVFGTVTLFTMRDLLVRQLRQDLDPDQLAMVRVFYALPPDVTINNPQVLATLRAQPLVTRVEGQVVYPISWKKAGQANFTSSMMLAYSEPFDEIQLEPVRLTKGVFPQTGQQQVAIERRFADKYDLKVGDPVVVRVLSQHPDSDASGSTNGAATIEETWTISGIVFSPFGYPYASTTVLPEDSLYATYEDAQYLTGFEGFSSVYARYPDYETAKGQAEAFGQAAAPYLPILTFSEDPTQNSQVRSSQDIGGILGSLGLLALIVSGFLVFNVMAAIVTEQRSQIGIMKAIGATRLDSFAIYSGMALMYGLIGVVPGVLLAIPCGYLAAQSMASAYQTIIETFGISLRAIGMGIVFGLAIPVLASLLPVFNGTRVRIIEAITDLGIAAPYGSSPAARLVARLPIPITIRQGISNVLRKKGRMAFTALTLTVAAGAFMGVYSVSHSLDRLMSRTVNTFNYDFSITPTDLQQVSTVQTLVTRQFDTVSSKGLYSIVAVEIDGFDKEFDPAAGPPALYAEGYDLATGALYYELLSGRTLAEQPNGVLVAQPVAERLHKTAGDSLTIHAGGNTGTYTIVGIADYPWDAVWFSWSELSKLAGYVNQRGEPVPIGILFEINNRADPTGGQVADEIDRINEVLQANGLAANYNNVQLTVETVGEFITLLTVLFNFTALLVALVGGVGLLAALSMNVFERQKEIGVMRSVGAGSLTIAAQFLTEGWLIGLVAWLLGLPLSYLISKALLSALNIGTALQLIYSASTVVLGLAGMLVVTTISSLWPSLAASRKTVSNILRYQ